MSTVGLVASRSRAAERVNRVSTNMDRSTGYLLGNLNVTPSSTGRRGRDSSIGTLGRSNYESTLNRSTYESTSVRYRESSLTRGGRMSAADTARHSVMIPSSYETAKYNREQQMQDIHSSFMRKYNETTNVLNDRPKEEEGERRSKAYQKIISHEPPKYMNEEEAKKQCVSEMFMDTSKFSTKTLSAINGLEGAVLRKNKEYNWRKEMEDYEKRAEFERDVRARNVTALHRHDNEEESTNRKREAKTEAVKPIEKAAKQDTKEPESTVKSWRERRAARAAQEPSEPEPERKSWREKLAEKQAKDEEEKKQRQEEEASAAASAAAAVRAAFDASADAASAESKQTADTNKQTADSKPAEEDDESGAKKLRSDFNAMMSGLDAEFEAGRSKLAKLRERIRKAKMAVKDADTALAEDDKAIARSKKT